MSATKREANLAFERGKANRRGCGRIGDCPFRGKTPKIATLADEWRRGWMDQDAEMKRRVEAGT